MATITINLNVPDALVARVMTALRANHPVETNGLGDLAALKAVIRFWVRQDLAWYEGDQAGQNERQIVELARTAAVSAANNDSSEIT